MLELKNIRKSYKNGENKNLVLDNISINFRENEFVSILGPSGAGKTTLLNIIGGLVRYDFGELIINGTSTKKFKDNLWDFYRNNLVGFVFQDYNLINHISVLENVELKLILSGASKKIRRKKAKEMLIKVGLEKYIYKKPNELSGGQMQRVAIARALVNDPKIILADEPTGALDSKTSMQIMELIKEISKDKLVIMVTHNKDLARKYSTRLINLKDGKIIKDTNPLNDKTKKEKIIFKKTFINIFNALKLSVKNIYTKKGRTFITSFANSIGIIGIALILAVSNGFNKKINDYETDALSLFPISINKNVILNKKNNSNKENKDTKELSSYSSKDNNLVHDNNITKEYVSYVNKLDKSLINMITYNYVTDLNLLSKNDTSVKLIENESINKVCLPEKFNKKYLKNNFKLLDGKLPSNYNEIVLIVNNKNKIDKEILDALFIKDKNVNYKDVINKEFKIVLNDELYKKIENTFVKKEANIELYNYKNNITLKIVGVIKSNEEMLNFDERVSKIGYKKELINKIISINKDSKIVEEQIKSDNMVNMANISFDKIGISKKEALSKLGNDDIPYKINIYSKNFKSKEKVKSYLNKYNKNKIIYTDYAKEISSLTSNIMKGITIVLVFFSSISLIVSSIMIGIITYISVLERTKEIGILRSLGARKKDIARIFKAETFIIGLISGLLGIVITRFLLIFINLVLTKITGLDNIGVLSMFHMFILVLVSICLTMIGGVIPSRLASKKEPVESLRSN